MTFPAKDVGRAVRLATDEGDAPFLWLRPSLGHQRRKASFFRESTRRRYRQKFSTWSQSLVLRNLRARRAGSRKQEKLKARGYELGVRLLRGVRVIEISDV